MILPDSYVWPFWAAVPLIPWAIVLAVRPAQRRMMWKSSVWTAPFGLTEPLFVPEYWDPPRLFGLAQSTGWDSETKTWIGGLLFLAFYSLLLAGLQWTGPGYIERVWMFESLTGIRLWGAPLEELLFAIGFGMYWAGVYEHLTWTRPGQPAPRPRD